MPGIIWLASYPKSGNTWLRAFLANYLRNAHQPIPINDLPNHILGDNMVVHYQQYGGLKPEEVTREAVARLRPKVHQWMAISRGQDVFVKTHNIIGTIDSVPLITPAATAGAIYVVRNPFDVAISFAHHYQAQSRAQRRRQCQHLHKSARQIDGVLHRLHAAHGAHQPKPRVRKWTA